MDRTEFKRHVGDLYAHLYDLVYLRGHPLADKLAPASGRERGWRLHDLLLEVIKELDPGPGAPAFSREWRRYRLMVGRYGQGLDPGVVMQEIAVSKRQYYREHEAAIAAVADLLWERYAQHAETSPAPAAPSLSPDPLEAARLEAARAARAARFSRPDEVLAGVLALLDDRLRQRRLSVELTLPDPPRVRADPALLRQLLLGLLGFLIERAEGGALQVSGRLAVDLFSLSIVADPPDVVRAATEAEIAERLTAFEEMATLVGGALEALRLGTAVVGFVVKLPFDAQRTVLVVDDNEDVLELCSRYLARHDFGVVTATSAEQAIQLIAQLQPFAVVLDLMLPGQDGWDALRAILGRPATRHIPIVICSVLKQRELALSLGATAFLEKPITEERLIATLRALEGP